MKYKLLLNVAKYWRVKLLVSLVIDSQFAKILPNQSLPLKYFECRAEVICQFITTKSLVSIHSPIFYPSNILPCSYGICDWIWEN